MKSFLIATSVALFAIVAFEISVSDSLCWGTKPAISSNNSTCSNQTSLGLGLCQLRCLFCHAGNVSQRAGCITQNGTCLCLGKPGNGTVTTTLSPTNGTSTTSTTPSSNNTTSMG
ncbi:hypothetical protein Ocin01_10616 [Orchesella cincta]|uniref:Uncharacterized protein n=1 Tax=Orchesella cincta TaxID=48709 RepID=A0A1D2MSP5_ORCCI|nr:hypothetical protein Ocin01_10616 [Orchesella cincta]